MAYSKSEQLAKVKRKLRIVDTSVDTLLNDELDYALETINNIRRYTATETIPLEPQFYTLQVQLVVSAFSKGGAEGEIGHSENGISRSYKSDGEYPKDLLRQIIPLIKWGH